MNNRTLSGLVVTGQLDNQAAGLLAQTPGLAPPFEAALAQLEARLRVKLVGYFLGLAQRVSEKVAPIV